MMRAEVLRRKLNEKIAELPDSRLQEILEFVDCITRQEHNGEDPILKVAGCLSGSAISAEEIEEELYGEGASR